MKTNASKSVLPVVAAAEEGGHDHTPTLVPGTNGADDIVTGGGPQEILAGNGDDAVSAGGGPDIVAGGNGKDLLRGQGGPDVMAGGNGRDMLVGGPGPDVLDGGNGRDVLIGGAAFDVLTGGNGPDTFVFLAASEAPCAGGGGGHGEEGGEDGGGEEGGGHDGGGEDGGGHDGPPRETITDFKPGVDLIDLSGIGTVAGLGAAPGAYSVWLQQVGADTVVYVDTDGHIEGEKPEDLCIVLLGVDAGSVDVNDFLF